jgi:glutamyl-tRNA reductase
VITSTASQLPILGKGTVESALKARRYRPVLMVDIAVPRDIEPQVGDLRDVYLYSVDDLRQIVDSNLRARQNEVSKADEIIDEGIRGIGEERAASPPSTWSSTTASPPSRCAAGAGARPGGDHPRRRPAAGGGAAGPCITNKLIHAPTLGLKQASAEGRHDVLGHAVRLLGLPLDALEPAARRRSARQRRSRPRKATREATGRRRESDPDRKVGQPGAQNGALNGPP